VVFQGTIAVVYSMSVDRAVLMYVGDDVALFMLMNRMLLTIAMMIMAVHAGGSLRDEASLNRKRQRRRHHHDVSAPSNQGPPTQAQLRAPNFVTKPTLH
jgi:hypothetical protein